MPVTRNDVARRAGVSPAVVSYVLNDGPRPVSAEARQRVLLAVDELGYRPDGVARSLRLGRSHMLGLVMPDAANPFFAELARAVEDAAYQRGYAVVVCNSADDPTRERANIVRLAERRIEGLIIVAASPGPDLSYCTDLAIPVVGLDRTPDEAPVSTIQADTHRGACIGASHLVEHGHERIAFIGGPDTGVTDARRAGFLAALRCHNLHPAAEVRTLFELESGAAIAPLFLGAHPPTAALVASDVQAIGLLAGLHALGAAVPQDVAVLSIDGTTAGAFAAPPLSTVAQPIRELGEGAVAHLVESPTEVRHRRLDTHLILRASCGCPQPGSASAPSQSATAS
ncbi:MAG: LacI family DNA-binding transcriptional regulator [Propioniciclava sp.]